MINIKTFSVAELESDPAKVIAAAEAGGRVRIVSAQGKSYLLRPEGASPLDVPRIPIGMSTDEIVQMVRESREQERSWRKQSPTAQESEEAGAKDRA